MSENPPTIDAERPAPKYGIGGRCGTARVCACGVAYTVQPSRARQGPTHCSEKCAHAARVKRRADHYVNGGDAREHVRVAERALGRELVAAEEVHHVNEVRSDNRPENLVVCASRRAHEVLHHVPAMLSQAQWVGGVRYFALVEPPGQRFCIGCSVTHPLSEFGPDKRKADGLRGDCRVYRNRHRAEGRA